jgi:hypothetical protein
MGTRRIRLRAARAQLDPKVSQSKLAMSAGMPMWRYQQIETGAGDEPTDEEQQAIAAALGVRVSQLEWPDVLKVRAS